MDTVSIFTVILLIFASALCISLVFYLNRITKAILKMEENVNRITSEVKPLVSSFVQLTEKINDITEGAKDQVNMTKEIVTKVKYKVENILELEEKLQEGFEGSALNLLKNLSAVANGVSAFWSAYKKK